MATIERAICLGEAAEVQRRGLADMQGVIPGASFAAMDGLAPSRMDGSNVGSGEFCDGSGPDGGAIRWPEGYARHYIGEHDVVPTRRFFEYVAWRSSGESADWLDASINESV